MIEYTVWDRRNAEIRGTYVLPDKSAKSEMEAIRLAGFDRSDWQYAEVETREVSDDASSPWVGPTPSPYIG